ncbi:hypothetical protein PR202_gb20230 [Eleusine coracana subsp. coracana]|uniref:Retrotransposon gag domain-containing protein n=1 Tax=Eleusine coracana subsp. coracana TaxID=191504 RepID=A0AAV5FA99_ELECO|nr:hypothetical protein PR202_gb20210 [Eleusine coracana subsp. coracana]GJN31789.1 hypothetical protein PR202_gb20230 [Eleusine coracana subsp. coracana]
MDPRDWLHVYSTAIRALDGDNFVMANYLHVCLAPAARTWLTNLPDNSITSWADLCRQLMANFQATFDRPGNHWELGWIKQRDWEPLREYIQRFCRVKNTIPNISDAQVVAAFQGGLHDDDLIKKIGRLDAAGRLSAKELFTMADKYAAGNSALFQVRQYKEATPRNQSGPSDYSKDGDRKRKQDRTVANTERRTRRKPVTQDDFNKMLDGPCLLHDGAHKARECFKLKNFAHHALKVCKERPWIPKGGRKDSD